MRTHIINKHFIFCIMGIIVQLTFFGCRQKTVKFPKLFDNYLLEKNESLFSNSIDKQIVYGDFKGIKQGVCSIEQNGSVYQLQFYTYKDAPKNGMFITLETMKEKNKRFNILKDIAYLESNKGLYIDIDSLSHGEKNYTNSYADDENKFEIYDLDLSKEFPYYIVSVEDEKLHIEFSNQATIKFPELFDKYLLKKDESLFSNSIGKQIVYGKFTGIGRASHSLSGSSMKLNGDSFIGYYNYKEKGFFLTLETIKDKNRERFCILNAISYFESNYSESNKKPYTSMEPLSYGEKNHTNSYAYAEDKFGIYDLDLSKEFPYYKKIIPRYIVSVENEKLHIEVPKNEDLFVYLYNEI